MKKNVMGKNLRQSILRSITRYIAIVAIIALGSAMFVGLRSTKNDMIVTGQIFMDRTNMFDLRLLSTYGWNEENVAEIAAMFSAKQENAAEAVKKCSCFCNLFFCSIDCLSVKQLVFNLFVCHTGASWEYFL